LIGETSVSTTTAVAVETTDKTSQITDIMSYFPLATPRGTQKKVIEEIDKAFKSGKRIVILEAPVGAGKSAIAMTFARAYESSHIITPRKSLQDQYYEDFEDDIVLMKGRNAYPCTIDAIPQTYIKVMRQIDMGMIKAPGRDEPSCASGPCNGDSTVWKMCIEDNGPCPYSRAIEIAQEHHTIVHNIHSFIFQTKFGGKFEGRNLLIVDEAHEIEGVIREFITRKISTKANIEILEAPEYESIDEWGSYLLEDQFLPEETAYDRMKKEQDPEFKSARDEYVNRVQMLNLNKEYYEKGFSVRVNPTIISGRRVGTSFEFVPHSIGNSANHYLFDYGEKVLLMSGTIYDHDQYCKSIGVNPSEALSIKIPSSFPVQNRPIYLKPEYQTDTSHANWRENFDEMIGIIDRIQNIFKDVKGLIHAPSYMAAQEIVRAVPGGRLTTHESHNFQASLEQFYASKDPLIFVSPVCQQGVDFKDDRARFQILTRVPYMNTSDPFVDHKVKNDFNWYNYQALIVFGQMIGRPVRSERDFGATFLLDSRFNKFVSRNSKRLPKWLQDAFIYR
jgi:Rad3-related DNA helicase